MELVNDVDGIYECGASFVAEPPLPRQHLFQFCSVVALGFIGCASTWQAFFQFLEPRITWTARIFAH